MKIIGLDKLSSMRGEIVEKWLFSWIAEIKDAHWRFSSDVIKQFPKVRASDDSCFEFSVSTTQWVICIQVAFLQGIAIIKEVKG